MKNECPDQLGLVIQCVPSLILHSLNQNDYI
jgi:hypothetical protein